MELADLMYSYNLNISGSRRFLTQLKSQRTVLVTGVKVDDKGWRSKFFFVNLSSLGDMEKSFLHPNWTPTGM